MLNNDSLIEGDGTLPDQCARDIITAHKNERLCPRYICKVVGHRRAGDGQTPLELIGWINHPQSGIALKPAILNDDSFVIGKDYVTQASQVVVHENAVNDGSGCSQVGVAKTLDEIANVGDRIGRKSAVLHSQRAACGNKSIRSDVAGEGRGEYVGGFGALVAIR